MLIGEDMKKGRGRRTGQGRGEKMEGGEKLVQSIRVQFEWEKRQNFFFLSFFSFQFSLKLSELLSTLDYC